jgi:hypothetical protein
LLSVSTSLIIASDTTLAFWLPSRTLRSWRPEPPCDSLMCKSISLCARYCGMNALSIAAYYSRVGS